MPLNYGQPHKGSAKKILSFILAVFILLLAILVMAAWMFIRYRQSQPVEESTTSDTSAQYDDPLTSVDCGLVILDFENNQHFLLVQTDPARNTIRVMDIPKNLADENGNTLSALLAKHSSLHIAETISTALDLPIHHYITWTEDGALTFLDSLGNGIIYPLVENMRYTNTDGATIQLSAGEQKLSGAQAAAVLQYTQWKDPTLSTTVAPSMLAAILNQYLVPQQNLDGYFSALADSAQTNLRIDNYNAFRRTLSHLADNNSGSLCQIVLLPGMETDGVFTPNLKTLHEQTDLYS